MALGTMVDKAKVPGCDNLFLFAIRHAFDIPYFQSRGKRKRLELEEKWGIFLTQVIQTSVVPKL